MTEFPAPGKYKKKVGELAAKLDQGHMETFLRKYSGFFTRYYKSTDGVEAAKFLFGEVQKIAASAPNGKEKPSVKEVTHTSWPQKSIIAKLPGDGSKPRVIIGAHLDSIVGRDGTVRSPGADDNGSGTTSLLEAFKVIVESGVKFKTPVEFHWYAAEEVGLLGSQAVANSYQVADIPVKAYMNLDMTAWVSNKTDEHVAIVRDFVDPKLADFLYESVNQYLSIPPRNTECGYACSDHASWTRAGYPAVFPFESEWGTTNPLVHTSNDTMDQPNFDWGHLKEFSKLALAFVFELAN